METKKSMITSKIKYAFSALKSFIMDNHGDTMIEILIAFTMLTICLGTLTGIVNVASKMIQMSKDQDVAQAEYDEKSAEIFSKDDAYNKDAISTLTYSFNGIFSMDINSANVNVNGNTLNVFTTNGESSSSYVKSLNIGDVAVEVQHYGEGNTKEVLKTTLDAYIIRVENNAQKQVNLTDDEKKALAISLTTDAVDAGITLVDDDVTGKFTLTYPSTVAGKTYKLKASYLVGTVTISTTFDVKFGDLAGDIVKSVTLLPDKTDERSSLGFGSTARDKILIEFTKDPADNDLANVTSDWEDMVGPGGTYALFVATGYEFKGWALCDSEGNIQKDKNDNEIIITGTNTSKVNVYNLENKMKEYIFDPEDTRTEYYFKAKVEEVSSGAMLCTNLKTSINNLTNKAEVYIKRQTGNISDSELSSWTRVDIVKHNPNNTVNGKKLSTLYTTPIYMKYDSSTETLWWYSEANTVYMAPGSYKEIFKDHTSLSEIEGLADWDVSYVTGLEGAFRNCSSLEDITPLKDWNTYNNTTLNNTFGGATSIKNIDALSNWKTGNVINLGNTFNGCTGLTDEVTLNWDTSKVTTMEKVFYGCTSLSGKVTLNWDMSHVTSMKEMFRSDSKI